MLKVSIIIPVYNTQDYLKRCLDSALKQTIDNFEVICINDASTDSSINILKDYAKLYKNMIIINCKCNRGAAYSRNLGIARARGKYIGFIDSDDYVDLDYFKTLYEYSIENEYDVIRGIRVIDENCIHGKNEYGCIIPSIIRRKLLVQNPKLRFPISRIKGEDSTFKAWLYKKTDKIFECPDTGVYYHYMRREGSLSNYTFSLNE